MSDRAACRAGAHGNRHQQSGTVECRATLPEVPEQEPNSDFASPQAVALGCTISGVVQNEDVDYFVGAGQEGPAYCGRVGGSATRRCRRATARFSIRYVAILNAKRFELARCDDAALLQQDCLCAILAPEDGTYVIEVRESAYGGSDLCKYRLHVGSFPRPTAVFPPGGDRASRSRSSGSAIRRANGRRTSRCRPGRVR